MSGSAAVKAVSSSTSSASVLRSPVVAETSLDLAGRLMESLLHDARNPLNAIAINLEVLTEKLKAETGEVPPSQEKNLKAMREQVFRVDAILKLFAEFIAPHPGAGDASLTEVVQHALEVLGHESRKRRIKLGTDVDPNVLIRTRQPHDLQLLVLHALMRSLLRTPAGGEVTVIVHKREGRAFFAVRDSAGAVAEPSPEMVAALDILTQQHGAELRVTTAECGVLFPAA